MGFSLKKITKKIGKAVGSVGKSAVNWSVGMATVGTVKPFKSDKLASRVGDVAKITSRTALVVGGAYLAAGAVAAGAAGTAAAGASAAPSVAGATTAASSSGFSLASVSSLAAPAVGIATKALAGKGGGNEPGPAVAASAIEAPSQEKVLLTVAAGLAAVAVVAAIARR